MCHDLFASQICFANLIYWHHLWLSWHWSRGGTFALRPFLLTETSSPETETKVWRCDIKGTEDGICGQNGSDARSMPQHDAEALQQQRLELHGSWQSRIRQWRRGIQCWYKWLLLPWSDFCLPRAFKDATPLHSPFRVCGLKGILIFLQTYPRQIWMWNEG